VNAVSDQRRPNDEAMSSRYTCRYHKRWPEYRDELKSERSPVRRRTADAGAIVAHYERNAQAHATGTRLLQVVQL